MILKQDTKIPINLDDLKTGHKNYLVAQVNFIDLLHTLPYERF